MEDSPSEASPHPDALEGRISASVKLAIESRHEEHEEDTFTPLIAGRPGVSASGKKDPVEDVDGEQKPTRLALYESDLKTRPRISVAIAKLVQYDPTPANPRTMKAQKKKKGAQLGTLMGVYLPCLQNILGVILFLRLTWIVGTAGWLQAFVIVSLCCLSTLLTAISLSAIATNGVVPAGGAYFLISRNLGPEIGGAVGILFYLGNAFACSLYVLGAVELLLKYIAPQMVFLGDANDREVLYNSGRIYGTILLIFLSLIVFVGVKFVNYFASFALFCVIVSVVSIYAGAFDPRPRLMVCGYNGVLIKSAVQTFQCPQNIDELGNYYHVGGGVKGTFCDYLEINSTLPGYEFGLNKSCCPNNPSASIFPGNITCIVGIPGITDLSVIQNNALQEYTEDGETIPGQGNNGIDILVTATITSSFLVLIGIFYPSVTGIMAGSNRSGDLKDAQKSIPIGTLAAIATTSVIYLTCILFFGGTIARPVLRDQLGDSYGGLAVAKLAFPTEWLILIGALLSTIGAALQTLTGAPRLLQAIAMDNLIPILKFFTKTFRNEPTLALIATVMLAEVGILIAVLDFVAPILTMFFLMLYLSVNASTAIQSILKAPNWRPRFKLYHWSLSIFGGLLVLVLMFLVSWYYALGAIVIALIIYKYIEFRGAEKEWGDGLRGLSLQAARYSLLKLEEAPPHTKNWRPQILVLMKPDVNFLPSHPKLLSFASQLKAGKGLTLVTSVIEGDYTELQAEAAAARQTLKQYANEYKMQGFCEVVICSKVLDGLSVAIQSAGLGGMKPNTVLFGWPDSWRKKESWRLLIKTIRIVQRKEMALLVARGINWFPSNIDKPRGSIDVWWIVHDGGLLMLLPFLLRQHKVWRRCSLRIFTVAQIDDNSIQMKKDLEAFLYQLRLEAEVHVIEMPDEEISEYTYERTLIMEQRFEMLKQMKLTNRDKSMEIQSVVSSSYVKRGMSRDDGLETKAQQVKVEAETTPPPYTPQDQPVILNLDEEPVGISVRKKEQLETKGAVTFADQVLNEENHTTGLPPGDVPMVIITSEGPDGEIIERRRTFSASSLGPERDGLRYTPKDGDPQRKNVLRMDTSVKLNELIVEHSHNAQLVLVNLPGPPETEEEEQSYMEFLDVLTEGLDRVLMVRGGGREVITIYS